MAPTRRQPAASPSSENNIMSIQRSPVRKAISITQRQKQALIDNLQLEITERARRLRAQYALQAQSLRSKLERRVSRVPLALRNQSMGELMLKYAAAVETEKQGRTVQVMKKSAVRGNQASVARPVNSATIPQVQGKKRKSDEMHGQDKENTPDPGYIPTPKRQVRDAGSRTNPTMVLSPKSNNSRTLPQSPEREPYLSNAKMISRPNSPLKTATSPFKAAAINATAGLASMVSGKSMNAPPMLSRTNSKTTKAPTRPTKVTQSRTVSGTSNASGTSNSSTGTIVRKVGAAIKSSVAAKKTAAASSRAAAPKKTTAAKTKTKIEVAKPETATAGRRILRSRP